MPLYDRVIGMSPVVTGVKKDTPAILKLSLAVTGGRENETVIQSAMVRRMLVIASSICGDWSRVVTRYNSHMTRHGRRSDSPKKRRLRRGQPL